MAEKLTTVYDGIEIEYLEDESKFCFELRGKECKVGSLKAAKETIDKPEPVSKKKFAPVPGWKPVNSWDSSSRWESVNVTSIAEKSGYGSRVEVWISKGGGGRAKVERREVFAATPANDKIRAELDDINKEIKKLEGSKKKLFESLKIVDLSSFED